MLVRRTLPTAGVAALACIGLAACGGGGDNGTTTSASSAPQGDLFAQTGGGGTLTPIKGRNDVYTLTLTDASPAVTQFTDRPVRHASSESLGSFVDNWGARGFDQDPPNAALVLDQQAESADTSVFELASPRYDAASDVVSYRATHVEGGTAALPHPDAHVLPPTKFGQAHLFIDPGSTPTADFFVHVSGPVGTGHTAITLDSPFEVFVGSGSQEAVWAGEGGGFIGGTQINLTGPGQIDVQVAGGTPPITGKATVPSGATATVQVNDGTTQKLTSGGFSVGG